MIRRLCFLTVAMLLTFAAAAQQWTGTSGLLHVPSADMSAVGELRVGGHFLNKAMTPDTGFIYLGSKYHAYNYYLSVTPYRWIELSIVSTARKNHPGDQLFEGYGGKDRHVSIKIRPFKEGKVLPAFAFGFDDAGTTIFNSKRSDVQLYFSNWYVAATKHFDLGGNQLGLHLSYRHFYRGYNAKWNGMVGGITFSPSFLPQAHAIVEYTGNEWQVGLDAVVFKHLMLQASLKDFKYLNAGLCLRFDLN